MEKFQQDRKSLNLVQNTEGIYECRGRIQGSYPIYLPKESLLTKKIIWVAHKKTIHGGVTFTVSNIGKCHSIPSLRKIIKLIIKKCHPYVRYSTMFFPKNKTRIAAQTENSRMQFILSDRNRLCRFYLLQIRKQGNIKVLHIIIFA